MDCDQPQAFRQAYADGELELGRLIEFEAHLQKCPACRADVEKIRAGRAALRASLPRYAAPARLTEKIRAALPITAQPRRNVTIKFWPYLGWATSLAAAVLFGLFIGLQRGQTSGLLDEALASHARSLMATHLMDVVSTDQHTVKPWFAGKTNFAPPVVDLSAEGFPLAGGRLDQLGPQPVAALVYARRKHFINLFVWPSTSGPLPEQSAETRGYHTLSWSQDGLNFIAVSEIPADELTAFVKAYRAQAH